MQLIGVLPPRAVHFEGRVSLFTIRHQHSHSRMKTVASLLVVACLASIATGQSLRIATYNVNWSNRQGAQLLDAISAANPDLICLQETTPQSEQFLRTRLANRYPHFHSVGQTGRYAEERFTFASKTELTDVTYTPSDAGLFGFYSASLRFDGGDIRFVNVHLAPFLVPRDGGVRDALAALAATEGTHKSEIASIEKSIDAKLPTIVVGDFNSLSSFCAPRRLLELGFVDAYASVHAQPDAQPTWHWPTRPAPLALRIDYIFHTPHFTATEADIIRRDVSDHSRVVAQLKWRGPL